MKKLNLKKCLLNPYFLIVIFTGLLFLILYAQFLIGTKAFVFVDIGSDTYMVNYPLYSMFSRYFHSDNYSAYMLDAGMGIDTTFYFFQYLNPMNLLVVLLPTRYMLQGLIATTYLKLLITNLLSYKLFVKITKHTQGALIGSFAWTFCGYMMLWGQHYGFLSAMMMFTTFAFLVYVYVVDEEKSRNYFLIPCITLMLFSNYYFLYMAGVFSVIFILVYMIAKKKRFPDILKKLFGLGGMAVVAVMIGGICFVSCVDTFMDSARSSVLNTSGLLTYFKPYAAGVILTNLARVFSNNTLGISLNFTGTLNYYEAAQLSVSALFFAGIPYLIMKKETRIRAIAGFVIGFVMLLLPISGKILNLNHASFRWTYILCFFEALAIAAFVKYICMETEKKKILISSVIGLVFWTAAEGVIYILGTARHYLVGKKILLTVLIFVLIYCVIACIIVWSKQMKQVAVVLMFVVLMCELVVSNRATFTERSVPDRIAVNEGGYHDGSAEAYEKLKAMDPEVFRLTKGASRIGFNDGMVSGYPEISVYMSTNPQEMADYKNMYGADSISDNHLKFMESNYVLSALMGTKYAMAKTDKVMSGANYQYMFNSGSLDVYEKKQQVPFGYLYDQCLTKETVKALPMAERTLSQLYGFYMTRDGHDDVTDSYARADYQTEQEQSVLAAFSDDMYGFTVNQLQNMAHPGPINMLKVTLKEPQQGSALIRAYNMGSSFDFGYQVMMLPDDTGLVYSCLLEGDIDGISFYEGSGISKDQIKDVTFTVCTEANAALKTLAASPVTGTSFEASTYRAHVVNDKDHEQMFVIPLFFSKGWVARVDGEVVPAYNVNSGFTGIQMPVGEHEVVLEYHVPHMMIGIILTIIGVIAYVVIILLEKKFSKRSER